MTQSWVVVVVAHGFNLSTQEAVVGKTLEILVSTPHHTIPYQTNPKRTTQIKKEDISYLIPP